MAYLLTSKRFPCPVCATPQDVRGSKKGKPYVTCNACGVQLFIRGKVGIDAFEKLLTRAAIEGTFARVNEMIRRYHVRCSDCGSEFWIEPSSIVTSVFDGSLKGVRCPNAKCEAVIPGRKSHEDHSGRRGGDRHRRSRCRVHAA
jgi:transcription elongation factor Elf1